MSAVLALLLALQAGQDSMALFVAQARAGTERFRDPQAALAEGYRPVGPDFPTMGQHWIHPGLVVEGALDPARPHVLEYVELQGTLTLVGVAYVALVTDGRAPGTFPVPVEAWHFHGGTVSEESFVRGHALGDTVTTGPRLAVLHAWIWFENPAGLFATDNGALPFARLGLPAPAAAPRAVGEALALATSGGATYAAALLKAIGRPDSTEAVTLGTLVTEASSELRAWLAARGARTPLTSEEAAFLAARWERLWDEAARRSTPAVRERLAALRPHH